MRHQCCPDSRWTVHHGLLIGATLSVLHRSSTSAPVTHSKLYTRPGVDVGLGGVRFFLERSEMSASLASSQLWSLGVSGIALTRRHELDMSRWGTTGWLVDKANSNSGNSSSLYVTLRRINCAFGCASWLSLMRVFFFFFWGGRTTRDNNLQFPK